MDQNDRAITALVMLAHGAVHTYEMTIPIFVTIWLVEFETLTVGVAKFPVTTATVGAVVTVGYSLFGFGALPGGVLVDRVGSRRLISLSLFGMGVAYLTLGVAPGMAVVAFALVVWGVAASVYHPSGLSLVSRGVKQRGTGLAYHGMAGNLGIGLGPLLAAILLLVVGWRTVALVLGAPALLAGVYAWLANFDETAAVSGTAADGGSKAETGVDSVSEFLTESRRLFTGQFLLVFGIVICSGLYYRGILTFLPEVLSGFPGFGPIPVAALVPDALHELLGIEAGGRAVAPQDYFYSGLLSIGMVGQYLGGRVTDEFQVEYGLVAAFGALAVLAMLFVPASSRGLVPLAAVGALLGVCLFVVQPMYQATVAEYTPADVRGLSYGYTYLGVFGVGAVGGVVAGALLAFASTGVLFVTLAGVAVSGALLGAVLAT